MLAQFSAAAHPASESSTAASFKLVVAAISCGWRSERSPGGKPFRVAHATRPHLQPSACQRLRGAVAQRRGGGLRARAASRRRRRRRRRGCAQQVVVERPVRVLRRWAAHALRASSAGVAEQRVATPTVWRTKARAHKCQHARRTPARFRNAPTGARRPRPAAGSARSSAAAGVWPCRSLSASTQSQPSRADRAAWAVARARPAKACPARMSRTPGHTCAWVRRARHSSGVSKHGAAGRASHAVRTLVVADEAHHSARGTPRFLLREA
jgi:hypothetical protein